MFLEQSPNFVTWMICPDGQGPTALTQPWRTVYTEPAELDSGL